MRNTSDAYLKLFQLLMLSAGAVLAAVSCAKEGTGRAGDSLRFSVVDDSSFPPRETKSSHTSSLAVSNNTVKVLNLYAWNNGSSYTQDLMENVELTYTGTAWSYSGATLYWPGWTVGSYKASACHPSDAPLSGNLTDGYTFTVPADYTATPDLMYAYYAYTDNASSPSPFNAYGEVTLPFSHMLSSILLTLESDSDTQESISASDISITLSGYPSRKVSGSTAGTWLSPTAAVTDYEFNYSGISVPVTHAQVTPLLHNTSGTELTAENSYVNIIPVPSASSAVVVSVTYNTNTYTATISGQEFSPGRSYTIALTLQGRGGVNFRIFSSSAGSFYVEDDMVIGGDAAGGFVLEADFTIDGSSAAGGFVFEQNFEVSSATSSGIYNAENDFTTGNSSGGAYGSDSDFSSGSSSGGEYNSEDDFSGSSSAGSFKLG